MAFRPNYRQARSERDRAKQLKKQEKLQKREEDAARRKGDDEPAGNPVDGAGDESAVLDDGADSAPSDAASPALPDSDE